MIKISSNNDIPFSNSVLESALCTKLDSKKSSAAKNGCEALSLQTGGN